MSDIAELVRLRRLAEEYDAALLMLNRAGFAGSEYTRFGGLLLAVKDTLRAHDRTRHIKGRVIAKLRVEIAKLRVEIAELQERDADRGRMP